MPPRIRALTCILINLVAFPGLGSILMRRRVGWIQAPLMVAGFIFSMGFGLYYLWCAAQLMDNPSWGEAEFTAHYRRYLWAFWLGLGLCVGAWVWAMFTSMWIWRSVKADSRRSADGSSARTPRGMA